MYDYKSIFASRTFWGGFIAIAAGVLGFFGYELGGEEQQHLIESGATIAASLGGVIAIWGRVKATKEIK